MNVTEYIQEPLEPFQRGVSDCIAWSVAWAEIQSGLMIGRDELVPMTKGEAIRLLHHYGGMVTWLTDKLSEAGWYVVRNGVYESGDILVMHDDTALFGEAVGIVNAGKLVTKDESGALRVLKIENVKGAWRWE